MENAEFRVLREVLAEIQQLSKDLVEVREGAMG